jgi:hypothetical protein
LGTKIENKDFFRHGAAKVKNLRLVWTDGFIYPPGSCILVTWQRDAASNRAYLVKLIRNIKTNIMKRYGFVLVLAITALFTSCNYIGGRRVRGDGNVISQDRNLRDFNAIEVSSAIHLTVTQDSAYSVKVETDSNLQELVEVYKEGGVLRIRLANNISLNPTRDVAVYVSGPSFDHIGASGACNVVGKNMFTGNERFDLELSGASEADLQIDAPVVNVELSGACKATLKGKTRDLRIDCSGSSSVRAFELPAENVSAGLSGASNADVFASVRIEGELSGASDMEYKGGAQTNIHTSGASSIRKVE